MSKGAMSKKHFQAIARALHGLPRRGIDVQTVLFPNVVDAIADVLAADSPRFDRARFVEACETGGCKGMPAPPMCAQAMGCLCAGHARNPRRETCDTHEFNSRGRSLKVNREA